MNPVAQVRRIPPDAIDWSFAIRPIDAVHLDRLAGAERLPSMKVWEFQPGQYRGIDGLHRWRLAKNRGESFVEATVRRFPSGDAGQKMFDFECVKSNLRHGLPLTRDQRDEAIRRIWKQWGRSPSRSHGETLDDLGRLFNLTKQRIQQIIAASDLVTREPVAPGRPRPGGFSGYGRFSAATRRLSGLLRNTAFVDELLHDRESDVITALLTLHRLIDQVVSSQGSRNKDSPATPSPDDR